MRIDHTATARAWVSGAVRFALMLGASVTATALQAQDYPGKPIRMIVPYPAGGVTDVAIRLVAPKMIEALGQPIVIENLPAAGGVVATNAAVKAAPDGYTLIATFDSFVTNPYLYQGVHHDPLKDFAPVSLIVKAPQLLVAHPGVGVKTTAEFIDLAKRQGDRLAFATAGAATSSRFSVEAFKGATGIDATVVSYKGGAAALNDLLGGQVAGFIGSISLVIGHVQRGKLVALGVSSPTRIKLLPDVPPIRETVPGFEAQSWTGMVVPAATPRPIIDRVRGALLKALEAPDVRGKFEAQGVEVVGSTPEEFGAWMAQEARRWGAVIKERNIRIE